MSIKIGHSSKDERGKASGGQSGDQTGKEVCTRSWYNGSWGFVARARDANIAEKMAAACEAGCANPNIGYDQSGRNTLRSEAKKVGYDLSKITAPCECDCSAFMGVCVEAAGVELPSGNGPTTRTLERVLQATGKFDILTDGKFLTSDKYLKRSDILCKAGSHTVMALENGVLAGNNAPAAATAKNDIASSVTYSVKLPLVKSGDEGEIVKTIQQLLILRGADPGEVDGEFGKNTRAAVEELQRKANIEDDGKVGGETWPVLLGKG